MTFMHNTFIRSYRLDYFFYVISIIVLYFFTYSGIVSDNFIYVPLMLAWVPLVYRALKDLYQKKIGNDFFLVFATVFSLIGNEEKAIMIVLIIMLLAHYAELLIENRTHHALESLIHLIPTEVIVRTNQEETIVSFDQVQVGTIIIVKTGGRIPVDGIIVEGIASINESVLTGESEPKQKKISDYVFAGTFVETGSIVVKTEKIKEETLFGKITSLLIEAKQNKAKISILAETILKCFTPLYLLFITLIWFVTYNTDTVLTLFIFGSPLELALVTPLTVLAGTVAGFRNGILIKSGRALELLAYIDIMIFDKTGTITLGEPRIVNVESYDSYITKDRILFIAAIAEKYSDHVVAKALEIEMQNRGIHVPKPDLYDSKVGHGVEINYQNVHYFFGNQHFTEAPEHGNSVIPIMPSCLHEKTHSIFYLSSQGKVLGKICMADALRPNAQQTIDALFKTGIKKIMLLSGDRQEITDTIAEQINISEWHGEMFPDQKLIKIKQLQEKKHIVAMVGDGINDAAALEQANIGIAMGAMGMEPAINAADIVLMTNELNKLVFIRKLAQKVFSVIKQNLIFGFLLLHIVGILLTLMHFVTPLQAAFAHAFSDVFILINASRLIYFKAT